MEILKLEEPSIARKKDVLEFIDEYHEYNSTVSGLGSLEKYKDSYENWLERLDSDKKIIASEERVPTRTFFLVRESDNKTIGLINIRLELNERLKHIGGVYVKDGVYKRLNLPENTYYYEKI